MSRYEKNSIHLFDCSCSQHPVHCESENNNPRKQLPEVITENVAAITRHSAITGGTITNDGGHSIVEKGVCWSTTPNPTITNSRTTDGMGSESFESIITGLDINTEYYVRAFAINSDGPGYGNQEVFTTSDYVDSVYVNFTIAVFDPEYAALLVPGNSITVIGGANGILIYRISDTDFAAYDRTCTYPVEENCQVKVDNSGVFAVDTLCCKSKYLLLDGSVVRGPATYPLKSYRTSFDGTYLRVFN